MKKLKLPKTLLATVAAPAILAVAMPASMAQGQTETKIRLMADALRARDSGDLDTAKKNLEELLAIAPNDATVQRLLNGVNAQIATRSSGAVVEASSTPVSSSEPVQVSFPAVRGNASSSEPVAAVAGSEADIIAKQEDQRINGLIADARAKRGEARSLSKDGRFDEATAVLDGAINSLPANPATAPVIADLQAEKNGLLLEKAQYALKQGDTAGARAALELYSKTSADTKKAENVARSIDKTELNPPLQPIEKVSPKFIEDQKAIAALVAKGRSQYLAGDSEGARETFSRVEAIDTSSVEAKSFLARIAKEKAGAGELNRQKTRSQLLEEVTTSWQRPGVYVDQTERPREDVATPLVQKLNNIVIPSVNFNGVELSKVVQTLTVISPEYDTAAGVKGVSIVLMDPSQKNPTVNVTINNPLPLRRILDLITEGVGYQIEVQSDIVVVRPGGTDNIAGLENAFFPVTRATVLRMTGMGSAAALSPASSDPFATAPSTPSSSGGAGGESASIQSFLEQAGVRFQGVQGASLVYDGAAIIVNQSTRNIERIRNILNRYNEVRQVEIEAKFMEVQQGALEELGVSWSGSNSSGSKTFGSSNRTLSSAFSPSAINSEGQIVTTATDFLTGAPSRDVTPIINAVPTPPGSVDLATGAASLAAVTGVWGNFDVTAVIRALSRQSGSDLLSAPKVTVLSGNPANIIVGQELRYPQSYGEVQSTVSSGNSGGSAIAVTSGTPQEFTMRNVGVELKVTPTVEEDDYSISLDLSPKVTEFEGFIEYGGQSVALTSSDFSSTTVSVPSGFYQPIFSTREITTKVTVWDGATLVMGGLTREEVRKVNDKVPVLGDIPFLGRAFRSSGETSSKRNLLIFVTANLVTPGGSPKKQQLKYTQPASVFQNPMITTPAGAEPRAR